MIFLTDYNHPVSRLFYHYPVRCASTPCAGRRGLFTGDFIIRPYLSTTPSAARPPLRQRRGLQIVHLIPLVRGEGDYIDSRMYFNSSMSSGRRVLNRMGSPVIGCVNSKTSACNICPSCVRKNSSKSASRTDPRRVAPRP